MSTATLRPNGTTSNSGVAVLPSGTAHGVLSDNSDSTQCSFFGEDELQVTLGDLTLPAGALIRDLVVRLRTAMGGSSPWPLTFSLTGIDHSMTTVLVSWTTITTTSRVMPLNEVVDEAQVDAAELNLKFVFPSSENQTSLYEAWVDVVYVTRAVATVTAPTGTLTTTNRPAVSWTATVDADGGPQEAFWVILRDDNGDTVESSGVIESAATSWTPTIPLADGDYTASVAVRQRFGGQTLWSEWDDQAFTIDVARPSAPLLEVVAQPASGRVAAFVSADVDEPPSSDYLEVERSADGGSTWERIRTDRSDGLFTPPDVEMGTAHNLEVDPHGGVAWSNNLSVGWTSVTMGQATIPGSGGHLGFRSAATSPDTTLRQIGCYKAATRAAVTPGETVWVVCRTYTVSGKVPSQPFRIQPAIRNSADTSIASPSGSFPLTAGWQTHVLQVTIPALGEKLQQGFSAFHNAASAVDVYITDMGIMRGRDSYADGDTAGWSWDGTLGASASTGPNETPQPAFDHEAPHGVALQYRARALHDYGAGSLAAGDWSTIAATQLDAGWWLKHATRPTLNVAIEPHAFPTTSRGARQGIHYALGRERPVVVSEKRTARTGTITLRVDTDEQRASLDELLDALDPLHLVAPPGQHWDDDWIAVTGDLARNRIVDKAFIAETLEPIAFTLVERPPGTITDGFLG